MNAPTAPTPDHDPDAPIARERAGTGATTGPKTRFTGSLADVSFADLLQTLEMSRKPGCVELDTELGAGRVWVRDGRVTDAELGPLRGEEAVYRVMMAEAGSFSATFVDGGHDGPLDAAPQSLLMEGARRLDEWRRLAGELAPGTRLAVDHAALEQARDSLEIGALSLLARLDGKRPVIDVVDLLDDDAGEQLARLRELVTLGVAHGASAKPDAAPARESSPRLSIFPTGTHPIVDDHDPMAQIYARYVLIGNSPMRAIVRAAALALMLATLFLGVRRGHWEYIAGGQLLGWSLLVLGHGATRRPELLFTYPSALLLEPALVVAEGLERLGLRWGFIARGRRLANRALRSS